MRPEGADEAVPGRAVDLAGLTRTRGAHLGDADEDPWLVLAGELLLARARPDDAERILEALERLAPDARSLLALDDPERALTSIGIKERARVLLAVAEDLVTYFEGGVPDDDASLRLLPGVGDYVGSAMLTFAFGRRQVLVDRTTSRVVGRLLGT